MNSFKEWIKDAEHIRQTIIIALICLIAVGSAVFVEWVKK